MEKLTELDQHVVDSLSPEYKTLYKLFEHRGFYTNREILNMKSGEYFISGGYMYKIRNNHLTRDFQYLKVTAYSLMNKEIYYGQTDKKTYLDFSSPILKVAHRGSKKEKTKKILIV